MEFDSVWVIGSVLTGNLSKKTEDKKGIELIPFKITADEFYDLITGKSKDNDPICEKLDRLIERQG